MNEQQLVVVCRGHDNDCRTFLEKLEAATLLLMDSEGTLSERFGIIGSPIAVMVRRGRIGAYGQPRSIAEFKAWRDNTRNDRLDVAGDDSLASGDNLVYRSKEGAQL